MALPTHPPPDALLNNFMISQTFAWLRKGCMIGAVALSGCVGFPTPDYWPIEVAPSVEAERSLHGVVKSAEPISNLTRQERALMTFIADPENVRDAIGMRDKYGTRNWEVIEVFLVEPGQRVSVLAEEGHNQEALYFIYHPDERLWYRVGNFEEPGRGAPAVRVRE